ncbi:hypothetical protein PoB_007466200, partial [Plakobranchus ocellatus]
SRINLWRGEAPDNGQTVLHFQHGIHPLHTGDFDSHVGDFDNGWLFICHRWAENWCDAIMAATSANSPEPQQHVCSSRSDRPGHCRDEVSL